MYEFRPATERILRMKEKVRDRIVVLDSERMNILTEAYSQLTDVVPIVQRSLACKYLIERTSIRVFEDEIIVGATGPHFFTSPQYPEWGNISDWVIGAIDSGEWELRDGIYYSPPTDDLKQCMSEQAYKDVKERMPFWTNHKVGRVADAWQPAHHAELERIAASSYTKGGMGLCTLPEGHLIAGYDKVIFKGYKAIRAQAELWIESHYGNLMGDDVNKWLFYTAAINYLDAASLLCKRYSAECARQAAECTVPKRKAELEKMADGLDWISENPARTFWEACQAVMTYQLLIQLDSKIPAPALGRFDQYTWPLLKKDLEAGTITLDEAQEIVDAFFLKANCFYSGGPAKLVSTTGIGNTYQHTTIGGVDPKTGENAENPVTYMVLESVGRLQLHDPTISLRINKNTSDKLWGLALQTSRMVGGLPLYQNDEVIIPSLIKELGFELEDARNYGIIGCQEIVGSGCDYPAPNGVHPPHASVFWGTIFDMAINNGINPANGEQASVHTGYLYEMNSIEEVRDAVKTMGTHIMKMFISTNNYSECLSSYYAPQTALSITVTGCMESGRDLVQGGAKYNSYGGTATGLATLADSLSTIKYMCFDKKLCTTRQLYDAVMANWEGHEELRQRILNEVPHYGNGDPYADMELKWCVDLYYDLCNQMYSVRSKKYKAGLYGASDHIAQGYTTWATPDGRKYGEPLADAMSPAQGRDVNGPTAVFESTGVFDHHHYMGGIALNMRMHPNVLATDAGIEKLRDMTKTYFEEGGLEVQYNVVDTETLRAAQQTPENYRDLVVRIAGYSAYFVEMGADLQNDIISRNENMI
ncbi:MAG: hypothetical protein IKT47_02430 [Oscillospiraceae bacterium]|nr:hypothetical protein [Oscillospiraceae bacterium]